MVVDPAGSVAVEIFAILPVKATVPSVVPPTANVTVPLGIAPVEDTTPAVKVTVSPGEDGLADEVIPVTVEAGLTTWFRTADVLFADRLSPRYSAVIAFVPTARFLTVKVATPLPFNVAVPNGIVPLKIVT